ncbi:hypothetical protein P12x_003285 [Tundrisphaera lichenicola]|uniref:hypothetical protein n=1 Tax=Tundrisphaera lichenicola TaxID=2029860 RepID=UPI003EBDD3AB
MRPLLITMTLIGAFSTAPEALGDGPADPLLRLVPPDSGITLAVEDLRDHSREIGESPLMVGLRNLPGVRSWLDSEESRKLKNSARELEEAVGVSMAMIRDDLAGDAVVFSYRPGPDDKPELARGLLLAIPRDPTRVGPLMKSLNDVQIRGGDLAGVEPRTHGPVSYSARKYRDPGRLAEYYVLLEGGVFAWSNSEEMIRGVINRKLSGGKGLGDNPAFARVRRGLPEHSIASLFVNPRLLDRAFSEASRSSDKGEERVAAMIARYVGAIDYAGAALRWLDGPILHTHEAIEPARLDPWLRRWLGGPPDEARSPAPISGTALAVASIQVDYAALYEGLSGLIPEADRFRLDNLTIALRGLLMGRDPVAEVLPRLGPETTFALEPGAKFPMIVSVGWSDPPDSPELSSPLDNALRTILALVALDDKREAEHPRVVTRTLEGIRVTELVDDLKSRLSYRVESGRLTLGNIPEAVARFEHGPPSALLSDLRSKYFPEAKTFALVDMARLGDEVRKYRGPIASHLATRSSRPVEAVDGDLDQLLSLAGLFRAALMTSATGPGGTEIHRTLGLIAR